MEKIKDYRFENTEEINFEEFTKSNDFIDDSDESTVLENAPEMVEGHRMVSTNQRPQSVSVVIKFWIFKLAGSCGGSWLLRAGFKKKNEAGSFFSAPRRDVRARSDGGGAWGRGAADSKER